MEMKKKRVTLLQYNAIFSPEEEGGYSVHVPDLPGCISQGDTYEEAKKNIKEAIELYLEATDNELFFVTPEESHKQFMTSIQVQL